MPHQPLQERWTIVGVPDSRLLSRENSSHFDAGEPRRTACCCCDDEWPTTNEAALADRCGDNAWFISFVDSDDGRRGLAHYRETYRRDLLK